MTSSDVWEEQVILYSGDLYFPEDNIPLTHVYQDEEGRETGRLSAELWPREQQIAPGVKIRKKLFFPFYSEFNTI